VTRDVRDVRRVSSFPSRVEGRSPERATSLKTSRPRIRRILSPRTYGRTDVPDVRRVGPWWVTTAQTWEESPPCWVRKRVGLVEASRRDSSSGVVVGTRPPRVAPILSPTDLGADRRGSRVPERATLYREIRVDPVSGGSFRLRRTNRRRRGSRVPSGRRTSDFVSGNTSQSTSYPEDPFASDGTSGRTVSRSCLCQRGLVEASRRDGRVDPCPYYCPPPGRSQQVKGVW